MRILLIFLLVFCTLSCKGNRSDLDKFSDGLLVKFANEMQKEGLHAAGIGGGCTLEKKINLMSIVFRLNKELDIKTARTLIVKATKLLLQISNNNQKSSKYFDTIPISSSVVHICIIGQENVTNQAPDFIDFVRIRDNQISYKKYTYVDQICHCLTLHEESFDEAENALKDNL